MFLTEAYANGLAVLTRLAKRQPQARRLLIETLTGRLDMLGSDAIEVAVEYGAPMGETLAHLVKTSASPSLAERIMVLCDQERHRRSVELRQVALVALLQVVTDRRMAWPNPT